jgi:hypothetical protein
VTSDATNTGYMSASSLSAAFVANYKFNGWRAGFMIWQYSSDINGTICSNVMSALMGLTNTTVTPNTTQNTTNSTNTKNTTNTTNTTNTSTVNISNPIRFAYVNKIVDWSPQGIARSIGLPGYAPPHLYNYVCFTFWTYQSGPLDVALAWN